MKQIIIGLVIGLFLGSSSLALAKMDKTWQVLLFTQSGDIKKAMTVTSDYICYNKDCSVRLFETKSGEVTSNLPFIMTENI